MARRSYNIFENNETGDFGVDFKTMIYNRLSEIVEDALNERKKHIAAIYFSEKIDDQEEDLQILKQGDDCEKDDEGEPIEKKKVRDDEG